MYMLLLLTYKLFGYVPVYRLLTSTYCVRLVAIETILEVLREALNERMKERMGGEGGREGGREGEMCSLENRTC